MRRRWAGALAVAMVWCAAFAIGGAQTGGGQGRGQAPVKAPAASPVNLNTATSAELEKLPGVGPAVAARIIEFRQKNGGFKKIEELMNVRGIGEKTFLKLKPLVTVAKPDAV